MWLLDTNICIYLIKRRPERVIKRLRALDISTVGVSSITVAELQYGVARLPFGRVLPGDVEEGN